MNGFLSRLRTSVLKNRENLLKSIPSEQFRERASPDQQVLPTPQHLGRLTTIVELRRSLPITSQEYVRELQFVGVRVSTEVRAKGNKLEAFPLKLISLFDIPDHAIDVVRIHPLIIPPALLTGFITLLDVPLTLLNAVVSLGNTAYNLWFPL